MSGNEVERFLGASHTLASRNNLPTHKGQREERFDASQISKINLGRMLAQVAIVPMRVNTVSLIGYGGDAEMLRALKGRIENRTLKLEGDIPFKAGGGTRQHFGGNVFVGGNVTITGGSFSSFSSGGSGGDMIVLNGREVDLSRSIQLALVVPTTMNIKVGGLIGAIGITDYLDATLDFSPSIRAELVAGSVKSLIGDLSGSGKATLDRVTADADLEVSGSGSFHIGSVGGSVDAKVSGSGNVSVNSGTSRSLRASVSGSGNIRHSGIVQGDARMRVSGSGKVVADRILGDVDPSISGSGKVVANGQTYRPRW